MANASTPLIVFLPKPDSLPFGEAMNVVRMWLDHRKVQPASFKLASTRKGFEIGFRSEADATAFGDFVWNAAIR
jgi:hypothetical protein